MSERTDIESELTPTEDLILEVLIARHRLGEPFWPIGRKNRKAIRSLEDRGLVHDLGYNIEDTFRVSLTLKGKAMWARPEAYVPPIFRDRPEKLQEWRQLQFILFDE